MTSLTIEGENWSGRSLRALAEHILDRFHAVHREQLPRLIELAGELGTDGAAVLRFVENWQFEIHDHLAKEEEVLFPMILDDMGDDAAAPISVMEQEHHEHDENLAQLEQLIQQLGATHIDNSTWQKLNHEFANFKGDLQMHVHLENQVLFPRALSGEQAGKSEPRH